MATMIKAQTADSPEGYLILRVNIEGMDRVETLQNILAEINLPSQSRRQIGVIGVNGGPTYTLLVQRRHYITAGGRLARMVEMSA
jgi:hypothetical protein